jgi:hypothetical protein
MGMVLVTASRRTVALYEAEKPLVERLAANSWGMVGGTNRLPNG